MGYCVIYQLLSGGERRVLLSPQISNQKMKNVAYNNVQPLIIVVTKTNWKSPSSMQTDLGS